MNEQAREAIAADVAEMMTRYSFDLGGYTLNQWLDQWLQHYPATWLSTAVTEALYQGRYKAISVWQILDLWRRRGKPLQHFNREFARMVSGRSLQLLFSPSTPSTSEVAPESILVTVESNRQQIWMQNGSLVDADWRRQTAPNPVLTRPTDRASSPWLESVTSAQASDRASDIASPIAAPPPAIEPFKPSKQFKLSLPGEIQRSRIEAAKYPIQQFVPTSASSDFYDKLKAIAQTLAMEKAQATADRLAAAGQPMESPIEPEKPSTFEELTPLKDNLPLDADSPASSQPTTASENKENQ